MPSGSDGKTCRLVPFPSKTQLGRRFDQELCSMSAAAVWLERGARVVYGTLILHHTVRFMFWGKSNRGCKYFSVLVLIFVQCEGKCQRFLAILHDPGKNVADSNIGCHVPATIITRCILLKAVMNRPSYNLKTTSNPSQAVYWVSRRADSWRAESSTARSLTCIRLHDAGLATLFITPTSSIPNTAGVCA